MIDSVHVKNFKSLRDMTVSTRKLTVLTGMNCSGKSSFIQSLLLAKRFFSRWQADGSIELNEGELSLGTQRDVFNVDADAGSENLSVVFNEQDAENRVSLAFPVDPARLDYRQLTGSAQCGDESFARFLGKIKYVSADRQAPQSSHIYSAASVDSKEIGARGENAAAILCRYRESGAPEDQVIEALWHDGTTDGNIGRQVDAWMKEFARGAYVLTEKRDATSVDLKFSFGQGVSGHAYRPENVGFGVSAILPLVVLVLTARPGDCLIIENPETHLHPRGQAEYGRLLALAAHANIQIFLETHSDHIINGIRVAVKDHKVDSEEVRLAFFERCVQDPGDTGDAQVQYSCVDELEILEDGELDRYPKGLLDEWTDQLSKLL